jgi:hypothetical protein
MYIDVLTAQTVLLLDEGPSRHCARRGQCYWQLI